MDYYKKKEMAFAMIDELIAEGISDVVIIYKLQTKYGFGKNILEQRKNIIMEIRNVLPKQDNDST